MFRPNRVGTPNIHYIPIHSNSTVAFTEATQDYNADANSYNVVNAAPVSAFGQTSIKWTGAESIPGNDKWGLGQQITVDAPLAGDTVGLEIMGSLNLSFPKPCIIQPVLTKLAAATGAVMAVATGASLATQVAPAKTPIDTMAGTFLWHNHYYRTQCIIRGTDSADVAGTYLHGFPIFSLDGAAVDVVWFEAMFSVRQLNDQQDVAYRDTLR